MGMIVGAEGGRGLERGNRVREGGSPRLSHALSECGEVRESQLGMELHV